MEAWNWQEVSMWALIPYTLGAVFVYGKDRIVSWLHLDMNISDAIGGFIVMLLYLSGMAILFLSGTGDIPVQPWLQVLSWLIFIPALVGTILYFNSNEENGRMEIFGRRFADGVGPITWFKVFTNLSTLGMTFFSYILIILLAFGIWT